MAYYPGKQPPKKLMGGNPQMNVGGYKNPSMIGPTTPGPVSGTYQPEPWSNEQGMAPVSGQDWNPGGSQGYDTGMGQWGAPGSQDWSPGGSTGPQADRLGYSPKPYPQPKPGPYRQDPNAPMYKALRSAMYQQKRPNEAPSGWGKTMDERNMPVYGPRQAGAYNAMFVGRPAGGGSGRFNPQQGAAVMDWWNTQKQARDNGTYTGYNTGLDDYQQRWGQGNTSALGLLQALNQRSR